MAATFTYVPPHKMFALFGSVSGPCDATYQPGWLVDGRTGFPVRVTSSSGSWTITGPAQDVDILCVGHHLLDAGLVVNITGGITTTITMPAARLNGIPLNGLRVLGSPTAGVTSLTVAVTGNTGPAVIIGEFCAGLGLTLPLTRVDDTTFTEEDFGVERPMDMSFIPPKDKGLRRREWRGTGLLTAAQVGQLREWHEAQRSFTRPSLIIAPGLPGMPALDPWFGHLMGFSYRFAGGPQLYRTQLVFREFPRSRY